MSVEFVCGETLGTSTQRVAGKHLQVTESVYGGGESIPEHHHPLPALCVVLEGGYGDQFPSDYVECSPGSAVYYAPGDPHSTTFGELGGRCLDITIDPSIFDDDLSLPAGIEALRGSHVVMPRADAFALHHALHLSDDLSGRTVEELALGLFADMVRLPSVRVASHAPKWLRRIRDWLEADFAAPPGLDRLAAEAGVHRVHLARAFRVHYGCTIGQFVRLRRVSTAASALRFSGRPLSHVAYEAGFADQSHFTRTFRGLVGIPPGEFRKRYRSRT